MDISRRMTVILTALVTAVTLGVVGAVVLALDSTPAPSIAPMAAADSVGGDGFDPWAEHQERCGSVLEQTWGPTEDDLAQMRQDNERLMAALDEAGVAYRLVTLEDGWEHLEPVEGEHEAFEEALEQFWSSEEEGGPEAEHLAAMREENEELTAHLDELGIDYEIVADPEGWEHVEPAGEDGWQAMEAFWHDQAREDLRAQAEERGLDVELALSCFDEERELSGSFNGMDPFPFPMDLRTASEQKAMVEDLMAAFDEAGIDYDRLDVPFLQWDRDDPTATDIVERIAGEHGWGVDMYGSEMMMEEEVVIMEGEAEDVG